MSILANTSSSAGMPSSNFSSLLEEAPGASETPPLKSYMKAAQKNGEKFRAAETFEETWRWLKSIGCEKAVGRELLEQYAVAKERWVQCEENISKLGLVAKGTAARGITASPFVIMGQAYLKQANQIWSQIQEIIDANRPPDSMDKTRDTDFSELFLRVR